MADIIWPTRVPTISMPPLSDYGGDPLAPHKKPPNYRIVKVQPVLDSPPLRRPERSAAKPAAKSPWDAASIVRVVPPQPFMPIDDRFFSPPDKTSPSLQIGFQPASR
ncbi:hypothetical protein [Bradyrhizobium prioriisuperbiae]|uniref:hypothetical protein n=1 Tax=Bradyrhizobium prioriisuperbiae TaxID=2854389 RepID=UPI0028E960CC|nr:hypothetical protein [Bradyrhizobium prioritasuperba]